MSEIKICRKCSRPSPISRSKCWNCGTTFFNEITNHKPTTITRKWTANICESHIETRTDGIKMLHEKILDYYEESNIQGSKWVHNTKHSVRDSEDQHVRRDITSISARERRIIRDKNGNEKRDEKSFNAEKFWQGHGTKVIGNKPESRVDKRIPVLRQFESNFNPSRLLEGHND